MLTSLRRFQSFAGLAGIVILAIIFSPTAAGGGRIFLELGNLTDILRQMALIGMIALAMTYVILTSGIDLSVGSILALSTSIVAMFLTKSYPSLSYASHIAFAIAMALAISTAAGFLNGLVIATLDLQPFVVTLASTQIGIRGLQGQMADRQRQYRYRLRPGRRGLLRRRISSEARSNRCLRCARRDLRPRPRPHRLRTLRPRHRR